MDKSKLVLYTIGHSTHQAERFLELLGMHAISAVCDVRSQPYSRHQPQFNREIVLVSLRERKIAYVYLGAELGARSDDMRCYSNGKVQFNCLSQTSAFRNGIQRVLKGMETHRVALMCAEKDPAMCHRTILICRHMQKEGVAIKHILADGTLEANADLEERLMKMLRIPQSDFFMDREQLVSRAYDLQSEKIAYVKEDGQEYGSEE